MFLKRVREEMGRQGLNPNALSKRLGAPPQRTIHDIMNGADPSLERVYKMAAALGVHAWELFRERPPEAVKPDSTVREFPQPPSMFADEHSRRQGRDRNKKRR